MTDGVDERKRNTLRRFAALGAAAPLAGTASGETNAGTDDTDDNETRGAIRGYVVATPGVHFSRLRDDLHLGTGEAQYHLRKLVDRGHLETEKDGDYRRYYRSDRFDAFEKRALGYLRRGTPRGIVLSLLRDPDASGASIAEELDVSRPTISSAVGDLEAAALLDRDDGYALRNPERLITLVVRYAESFGDDAVAFADDAASYVRYDP